MTRKHGKVYIVGAGPGDPELITVKAAKCLEQAEVILYDRLVNPVLLNYAKPETELIFCGKEPGNHCVSQEAINQLLVDKALAGNMVVRLKEGTHLFLAAAVKKRKSLSVMELNLKWFLALRQESLPQHMLGFLLLTVNGVNRSP
jgi:siroheme synthase